MVEKRIIENKELHGKCKEYVPKAFDILKQNIPVRSKFDDSFYSIEVIRQRKNIDSLEEKMQCIELMKKDAKIAEHFGKFVTYGKNGSIVDLESFLNYILIRLLDVYGKTGKYDSEFFEKLYLDMEDFFYFSDVFCVFLVPLHNFSSGDLDFGNGLSIRSITNEEKEWIIKQEYEGDEIQFNLNPVFKLIELKFKVKKVFSDPSQLPPHDASAFNPNALVEKFVTCLRLFKEGDVEYITSKQTGLLDTAFVNTTLSSKFKFNYPFGERYLLKVDEHDELKNYWQEFQTCDINQLKIAIRRFSFAYDRLDLEDKIVDYMIAFEALYFTKDENFEQNYKFSTRVAKLLEQDFEKRKELQREVKNFYALRSSIMHGNDSSKNSKENTSRIEKLLRISLKIFLKKLKTESKENIIAHLDLD